MLAEFCGIGASRVTGLETEDVAAHEVVPLDDLLIRVVVAVRPSGRIHETPKRVTTKVGAVGIELSTGVTWLDVDETLVNETDDLDVVWGLHKLDTPEGTSGNETSATTRLGTPSNFLPFGIGDEGIDLVWCPETEI